MVWSAHAAARVQGSEHLKVFEDDGRVNTADVTNNVVSGQHAVGCAEAAKEAAFLRKVHCTQGVRCGSPRKPGAPWYQHMHVLVHRREQKYDCEPSKLLCLLAAS